MKNKGFSLVELIVVIAIMAILVGVAVPVYTSYIDKAQKEADRQLVSEIKHAIEIANAADPFEGTVTIVLTNEGFDVVGGDNGALAAEAQRIEGILNTQISGDLKLKYSGWGNGVAATVSMLDVLFTGDLEGTMTGLLGNPEKLSFTEQIPELMDEIRNVASEVTGLFGGVDTPEDSAVIGLVQGAATTTSGLDLVTVQKIWADGVGCTGNVGYTSSHLQINDDATKLAVAALVRAKNTCVALYVVNNADQDLVNEIGRDKIYTAISSFSEGTINGNDSIFPRDIAYECQTNPSRVSDLASTLNVNVDDAAILANVAGAYLGDYGLKMNDAAAYYAMMKTVNETKDELSKDNLDEYFEGASVPVKVFQDLVSGKMNYSALANVEDNYGDNNIIITIVGNGEKVTFVIGPSDVLE